MMMEVATAERLSVQSRGELRTAEESWRAKEGNENGERQE